MSWSLLPPPPIAGSLTLALSSLRLDFLLISTSVAKLSTAAYAAPSSVMEPPMSLLSATVGQPTLMYVLHLVVSATRGSLVCFTYRQSSNICSVRPCISWTRWMLRSATQFCSTKVPSRSTTVVSPSTCSCGAVLRHTLASSGASSRSGRATCRAYVVTVSISTRLFITSSSPAPRTF